MSRVQTLLEPCLFWAGLPVPLKRDGNRNTSKDFDRKRLEPIELPWQGHHRFHFASYVMYISGAKFEGYCSNIPRDILDSVFYHFSCTVYYVITFLICIIQKRLIVSLERNQICQKGKHHSAVFFKSLQISGYVIIFHFIGTLNDGPLLTVIFKYLYLCIT